MAGHPHGHHAGDAVHGHHGLLAGAVRRPPLVEEIFDIYLEWTCVVAERRRADGFDAFVTTDDVAFGSSTFFSPKVFRELCMERYPRAPTPPDDSVGAMHSDGNMMPFMKDLLTLNIVASTPWRKGRWTLRETKRRYGDRLCLIGNVDLNILGAGHAGRGRGRGQGADPRRGAGRRLHHQQRQQPGRLPVSRKCPGHARHDRALSGLPDRR